MTHIKNRFSTCFSIFLNNNFFLSSHSKFYTRMNIILLTLFAFIINIPFGYWRANVQKFSLQFLLAIHLPILFIIAFRILSGSWFEILTFLFTVPAFFLGQLAGSRIYLSRKVRDAFPLTSCLVMDLVRVKSNSEK